MWVEPSGWGVPPYESDDGSSMTNAGNWQTYDGDLVEPAAAEILASVAFDEKAAAEEEELLGSTSSSSSSSSSSSGRSMENGRGASNAGVGLIGCVVLGAAAYAAFIHANRKKQQQQQQQQQPAWASVPTSGLEMSARAYQQRYQQETAL
jgi:hypothetical protein